MRSETGWSTDKRGEKERTIKGIKQIEEGKGLHDGHHGKKKVNKNVGKTERNRHRGERKRR